MKILIYIKDEIILGCLNAAHSGYWAREMEWSALYRGTVVEHGDDPKPETTHEITFHKVERGLELLLQKYPNRFAEMVGQTGDGETGDVFLQLVVLGDVIYG